MVHGYLSGGKAKECQIVMIGISFKYAIVFMADWINITAINPLCTVAANFILANEAN